MYVACTFFFIKLIIEKFERKSNKNVNYRHVYVHCYICIFWCFLCVYYTVYMYTFMNFLYAYALCSIHIMCMCFSALA